MIILAVIQDKEVDGQRKAIGRKIRKKVAIAIYKYGLSIAVSTGDGGVFVGKKFPARLEWAASSIADFCDVTPEECRGMLQQALCKAFEREVEGDLTLTELDREFGTTKLIDGSSGELLIYKELREKWAKDRDMEEGDLVLWSCTGEIE